MWLSQQKEFPGLAGEAVVVYACSQDKPSDRDEIIEKFKTTRDPSTYSDQPGVLVAGASTIETGLSLDPADVMITIDAEWDGAAMQQLLARISRSKRVQKARWTESYRLISWASWCVLNKWMADRQEGVANLRELLKNGEGEDNDCKL